LIRMQTYDMLLIVKCDGKCTVMENAPIVMENALCTMQRTSLCRKQMHIILATPATVQRTQSDACLRHCNALSMKMNYPVGPNQQKSSFLLRRVRQYTPANPTMLPNKAHHSCAIGTTISLLYAAVFKNVQCNVVESTAFSVCSLDSSTVC